MDELTEEQSWPKPTGPKLTPSTLQQQKERRAALNRNWLPPKHLRPSEKTAA